MFCEWRKFVVSERHFVLKFEAGFGGYRIFITDFKRLWGEEIQTEAELSEILKERAGSFEIGASDFLNILQEMIKSLPASFVSFEDGKLVLSHKLGFIKFNWTFQAQLSTEQLSNFLFNSMILPLLRDVNPSASAVIEEADIQLLNKLKNGEATNAPDVLKAADVPVTAPVIAPSSVSMPQTETQTTTISVPIASETPPTEPQVALDPAAVEAAKRKELEDRLVASSAAKKKKRLL